VTVGAASDPSGALAAVRSVPLWYHTIDVAPGVVTPGWFDLRPIVDRMPWPEVRGKRCLDVGTYDGFLAFELERRGAGEVVATDIGRHEDWDWPPHMRARGAEALAALAGPEKSRGFRVASDLLGSSVERVELSVYDLSAERIGQFDVVVCGSLLLHLRDPLRALEALRGVCRGRLLSAEEVDLGLSLLHPRRPIAWLEGLGQRLQWWHPNVSGHRRMIEATGFRVERSSGLYAIPFGPAHPAARPAGGRIGREWARRRVQGLARRLVTGGEGNPHHAVLARLAA
jgi:tRNA (mo5U34)-methyltransferase